MRLFYAVPVANQLESVYQEFLEFFQKLKKLGSVLKPVERENLHATILFLGDKVGLQQSVSSLEGLNVTSFKACFTSMSWFPSKDYIRVLWLGLQPRQAFQEMHEKLCNALGLKPEKRFEPHVTIARVKHLPLKAKTFLKQNKALIDSKVLNTCFNVQELVLYNSTLTSKGPLYKVVAKKSFLKANSQD
ncbi:RNA 2',3'-cyclic phosphodiesterase [Candidatus Woesearchaeota archaeon]|nr:RNA 2',3'-cyclic phosphodiesterase [Candidatus Woesearchaeota archaeon]